MSDFLRKPERSNFLGLLADALGAASAYADRPDPSMPMGKANPPLSLLSQFLGVPNAANAVDSWSYGGPMTNLGKANVPLIPSGTADAMGLLAMGAPVAKSIATNAAERGPALAAALMKNAASPSQMGPKAAQRGVLSFSPGMTRPEVSSEIKQMAENFADQLRSNGFDAVVEHSGSAAGPSSYVRVSDPQTGRFIRDPVRFSNHGKGVFNSQLVNDVSGQQDIDRLLQLADEMRAQGPTEFMRMQQAKEAARQEKIAARASARANQKSQVQN